MGCHFLLQGISLIQGWNPHLLSPLHWQEDSFTTSTIHVKSKVGWNTSWNQDCQEKYQQSQLCRWYHSNDRNWRGTKEPPDEGERGEWKIWLKTKQKTKILASSPITPWQIKAEKVEAVTDFIFLGSKIYCSHEIKRRLLLGRKTMTNLDSILKNRDIILPIKVHIVKAMVFPVVMYGCESWTIKKAEHWKIDALELWCWRLLRMKPIKYYSSRKRRKSCHLWHMDGPGEYYAY